MKHYKLREGENIRKPLVKRDVIEIRIPVLLLCLAFAFGLWLYVVSLSKIDPANPLDTTPPTEHETSASAAAEPFGPDGLSVVASEPIPAEGLFGAVGS